MVAVRADCFGYSSVFEARYYFPSMGQINVHDRRYFPSAIRTLTLLKLTLTLTLTLILTTITREPTDGK